MSAALTKGPVSAALHRRRLALHVTMLASPCPHRLTPSDESCLRSFSQRFSPANALVGEYQLRGLRRRTRSCVVGPNLVHALRLATGELSPDQGTVWQLRASSAGGRLGGASTAVDRGLFDAVCETLTRLISFRRHRPCRRPKPAQPRITTCYWAGLLSRPKNLAGLDGLSTSGRDQRVTPGRYSSPGQRRLETRLSAGQALVLGEPTVT